MTTPNSQHSSAHHDAGRDPIMEDDHFSLRYGNPINVIHNIKQHKVDDFEPTKDHVPFALAETIGENIAQKQHEKRAPLLKSNSSFLRDSTICSEFYHNKNGGVDEIDHDKK